MHSEPHDVATRIADAGMRAVEHQAERERVKLGEAIITLSVEDPPTGEANATAHAHLAEGRSPSPTTVLAVLCAQAQIIAKQEGIDLRMVLDGVDATDVI